ncbi:MAG: hypothetical protein ACFE75_13490 [Candidatus Hodarchaeota archaeon]
MDLKKNNFKELKDPEEINNFLIKLSENPSNEDLKFLKYFIDNLDALIFEKIKLNLVFLLGEIGKSTSLEDTYLTFLLETYYTSDRWIRNEIIQAIEKISTRTEITENVIELIGYAVNDDYSPIRVNAIKTLFGLRKFPLFVRRNVFEALNSKDSELEEFCVKIFEKFLPDFNQLFNSLNYSENYKILKSKAIMAILMVYFKSPLNIESFRELISASDWEDDYKQIYLKEIDTYEKILLRRL